MLGVRVSLSFTFGVDLRLGFCWFVFLVNDGAVFGDFWRVGLVRVVGLLTCWV